jgi:hypothetical protein
MMAMTIAGESRSSVLVAEAPVTASKDGLDGLCLLTFPFADDRDIAA